MVCLLAIAVAREERLTGGIGCGLVVVSTGGGCGEETSFFSCLAVASFFFLLGDFALVSGLALLKTMLRCI